MSTNSPSFITHELGHPESWICVCGNTESQAGFMSCDANGVDMEPVEAWPDLYRCGQCNIIIKDPTREIIRVPLPLFRVQFTEATAYETKVAATSPLEAARIVRRQLEEEGPEHFTIVSNDVQSWLAFLPDGTVIDINDDDVDEESSPDTLQAETAT